MFRFRDVSGQEPINLSSDLDFSKAFPFCKISNINMALQNQMH